MTPAPRPIGPHGIDLSKRRGVTRSSCLSKREQINAALREAVERSSAK